MKKMKLFLLAAMIVGAGSAFTTTSQSTQLWVKGPMGEAITIEHAQNDLGGTCNQTILDPACAYTDEELQTPADGSPVGRFTY